MAHKIRLEQDHQDLIAQALLRSLDHKRQHVVKNAAKLAETERQYADAIDKFTGVVSVNQYDKSIFTWLADQIRHSGPLRDQETGRRVLDICEVCVKNRYDDYISDRYRFDHLFDIDSK